MLVDITPKPGAEDDPIFKFLADRRGADGTKFPRRLAQGVWEFAHGNAEHAVIEKVSSSYEDEYPPQRTGDKEADDAAYRAFMDAWWAKRDARIALFLDKYKIEVVGAFDDEWTPEEERLPPVALGITRQVGIPDEYGTCDDYTQVLAQCPHIADSPDDYFISVSEIRRDRQSPSGGFRYHKNGPYIGTQKPEHEYLYDDTHIERIYGYHVYRIKKTADEVMADAGYRLLDMDGGVLIVAGKGLEASRLGIFPTRAMAYAECYAHNAELSRQKALAELSADGYTVAWKGMGAGFEVTNPDGSLLGPYDDEIVAIRYAFNHRRKAANEKKKEEEAAHG